METFGLYSYFSNVLPLIKSVLKERPCFFNYLNSFGPIINGQTYISPTNCLKYKTWVKVNYKKWKAWAYLYKFIMWKLMFSLTEDGARGGLNSEYPVITCWKLFFPFSCPCLNQSRTSLMPRSMVTVKEIISYLNKCSPQLDWNYTNQVVTQGKIFYCSMSITPRLKNNSSF